MSERKSQKTSYADAGVSIDRGNALVERIKPHVKATSRPGMMGNVGGFGALFDMAALDYRQPVLVSGTDGVGTKLKLAIESGIHDGIGIDLVAMCVNDLLVQGAEPLFFLDYYACSRLDVDVAEQVVKGIAKGCQLAGCALIGGETAEMPGMYQQHDYDLAGFCVGVVEKEQIIDGSQVTAGDVLIGLASSGPHSNGYSLIRKLLSDSGSQLSDDFHGRSLAEVLLAPTRIYIQSVLQLIRQLPVKAISHITGGGLTENLPRVLPEPCMALIDTQSWRWPAVFEWLQDCGDVDEEEMYRTFNCGIGLVLVVDKADADAAIQALNSSGEHAWRLGEIQPKTDDGDQVQFSPS